MMKKGILYLLLFCFLTVIAFAQKPKPVLFQSVSGNETGITFANVLKESPVLNIISYEYFYNGGGVGLGDFNNDGLTDIYFSGNMQAGKLYLNKGNLKFEDITAKAGV
jgi:enediyne biosynthesis protein E4